MSNKQRTTSVLCFCFALFLPSLASAQGFDYEEIGIELSVKEDSYAPGGKGMILVKFSIPEGYEMSAEKGLLEVVLLNKVEGVALGKLIRVKPDKVDQLGGHYYGEKTLGLPFTIDDDAKKSVRKLEFGFVMQACESHGTCFPPTTKDEITKTLEINVNE